MPPPSSTSSTTLKRIHREIADLKKEDLGNIKLAPSGDSLFHWTATLPGPEGSVYDGGVFNVDINLASDYPFSAPRMTFRTRIYHMNISERGGICIDILKHNWSPALSLFKVVLSLSSLLTDPNPKDPLVPAIATEFLRNRTKHDSVAREWTRLYARPPPPPPPVRGATPSTSSTRAKGKACATAVTRSTRSRSALRPSAGAVIEIADSDEEHALTTRASAARTRQATGKRKRGTAGDEAVDVDLVTQEGVTRASARRRTAGSSGSSTSRSTQGSNDVIVIED